MSDLVRVTRDGVVVGGYPCRLHSNRLFVESPDPSDANMRSYQEWGITAPWDADIRIGDTLRVRDIEFIVGEVVDGDTWQTALRVWGTKPKTATAFISLVLYAQDDNGVYTARPPQRVQVVYDRNIPQETPVRFAQVGRTQLRGGWLIGGTDFQVEVGDRFKLSSGETAIVTEILPGQPQRVEARFIMDTGGVR